MSSTNKKRSYGKGGVYEKKDGRFVVKFKGQEYTFPRGQKQKAEEKLIELQYANAKGLIPPSKRLLSDYFADWVETGLNAGWSPVTYHNYLNSFKNHVEKRLGNLCIADINTDDIQRLLNGMQKGYSYGSIRNVYIPLKGVFDFACGRRDLPWNPVATVKLPAEERCKQRKEARVTTLSREEVHSLEKIALMKNPNSRLKYSHANLIVLLLNTGLRSGEVRGLLWGDVDFKNCVLHINRSIVFTKSDKTGKRVALPKAPKTSSGKRDVPLNQKAVDALQALKHRAIENGLPCGDANLVARSRNGKPMENAALRKTFQRMAKAAGIDKDVYPHLCRHTFATRALKELGIDVEDVSKTLGHKKPTTTIDYYIHVTAQSSLKLAEVLKNL